MSDLQKPNPNAVMSKIERAEIRARIHHLEKFLKENPDQLQIEPVHHFSKDVYAREMRLKKDALIVGAIHRFENLNIISQGEVSIVSIDGIIRVKAPATFVASPGAKRVIYAHEDTVWTTIHGTGERDLAKIEDIFIAKNYDGIDGISDEEIDLIEGAKKCLGL